MAQHDQMGALEIYYNVGDEVEVCFERDDCYDIWFPATVVKYLSDNMYLVKHWIRKDSGEALLQNSNIALNRIRPTPPFHKPTRGLMLLDKVDAFYDFAWTSGFIIKEFANKQFMVSCKRTDNKIVFSETKLRPHVEWVDGKWVDEFQPKGADYDASQSRPVLANGAEIAKTTGCETDTTESKTPNKQNSSQKTSTSTMCKTDAARSKRRRNVSSSKTESRSLDGKVPKVAKNDASHSSASRKSKTETAAVIPTSTVCQTEIASKTPGNISSSKPETHSPDDKVTEGKKVSELDNNTIQSLKRKGRPPKTPQPSTKGAITADRTNDKECQPEHVLPLDPIGTESPQDNIRRQSHRRGSQTSVSDHKDQGKNSAELIIQTKGRKVYLLNNCTTESLKRMGRPPKTTPHSATGGKESDECARTAQGTDEKECESELVLPSVHNGMKIPQDNIPCQSHMEGPQTSISDKKGQGHNPAGPVIEERPKNDEWEPMVRSSELSGPRSKKEIPTKSSEKAKRAMPSDQLEKSSSKKRGKTSVNPSAKPHHSAVDEKDGKTSVDSSAKLHHSAANSVSWKETEGHAVTVYSNPCNGIDVNQILPFEKTVPLWDCIESMEVFQSIPQNPHFRPLESCNEDCREGLAIGHMVTFLKITKKIPELRLDMPRSSLKSSLENLVVLEANGFDVKPVRGRLNDLLVKKDKHDLLQNDFKEHESQILECTNKKAKIDEALDEIDKKLNELTTKHEAVVSEKELKDALIAVGQSSVDNTTNQMKVVKFDFETLAAAYW